MMRKTNEAPCIRIQEKEVSVMKHRWTITLVLLWLSAVAWQPVSAATILYTYDNSGRLIDTDFPDGSYIRLSYDNTGNIVSIRRVNAAEASSLVGDVYSDGVLDLKDVIYSLQVAGGLQTVGVHIRGDVNNDGRISVPETVYLLQKIGDVRTP